jgi:hypothetical protein
MGCWGQISSPRRPRPAQGSLDVPIESGLLAVEMLAAHVDPQETLFVKSRKRFIPVYKPNPEAPVELTLHCGQQEISFDEPDLFPWAETLIRQDSFLAGAAVKWTAQALEWPRVQGLLEALVAEGILDREPPSSTIGQLPPSELHLAFLEREAERMATAEPRFWNPDPGSVLREIAGREVEPGYIEAVVTVHRIAHIALDQEGRQVGESNSFPDRLRLKLPTEFRTCNYAGSRYHDDMQMNMTALRSMLAHWAQVLRAVLLCRDEFVKRYPQTGERWKLGEVHLLSSGILALPAFELMRWRDPVPNGQLDPVLSSLFRVTDGVRMVAAHLLDVPELQLTHDSLVVPQTITDMAEQEVQYLSTKGVCAGPQNMIDELVATLMHGKPLASPEPALGSWAGHVPEAIDYGLLGVQLYAVTFSIGMKMALALSRIHETVMAAPLPDKLREVVERDLEVVKRTRAHLPHAQAWSELFAQRMFAHAQRGVRGFSPADQQDLAAELTPPPELLGEGAAGALRDLLATAGEPSASRAWQEIAGHLLDFWRFERTALRLVESVQRRINTLLGRPQPRSPLTGKQLAIHHILRKGTVSSLPSLHDAMLEALGLDVENSVEKTVVSLGGRSLTL